ncbi:adenylate/guanylate cyclase domain-containing protein [Alteromonas sp. ASW11-19]|uniref:Adenylate/guanylate cyclase domain-containing protein n=1 Tax=Alteromonas salexigens TaxID=2982530 RepID=A0ABT2VMT5_9ALTE|nr:adenylate/guanylate cyclase domain-containing protein [Alteromonas salexigens]MCU7554394.1 adenylate/guanylate cyclase domain-containing protein [Alteromonas salexigens]
MYQSPARSATERHILNQIQATTRLVLICLFLQLPFAVYLLLASTPLALFNLSVHCAALGVTYWLCVRQLWRPARDLLLTGFLTFITWATLIWPAGLAIPYFLLLGSVTCGFFFRNSERLPQRVWAVTFASVFVALRIRHIETSHGLYHIVTISNTVLLAVASLLILHCLQTHTSRRWQSMASRQQALQAQLSALLPPFLTTRGNTCEPGQSRPMDSCVVLFADLTGFRQLTDQLGDEGVFALLHTLYRRFDERALHAGIRRIKTNGDEYMAAISPELTGLPEEQTTTLTRQMLSFARGLLHDCEYVAANTDIPVNIRIGVAAGPVRAGVIGNQRSSFDIWGRTVNLASMLEQLCEPNRVLLSDSAYHTLPPLPFNLKRRAVFLPNGPARAWQFTAAAIDALGNCRHNAA